MNRSKRKSLAHQTSLAIFVSVNVQVNRPDRSADVAIYPLFSLAWLVWGWLFWTEAARRVDKVWRRLDRLLCRLERWFDGQSGQLERRLALTWAVTGIGLRSMLYGAGVAI